MSNALKNIVLRVIKRRMASGETFEEIITDYPKLTADEVAELKEAVGE